MKKQNFKNAIIEIPQMNSSDKAKDIKESLNKFKGIVKTSYDTENKTIHIKFDAKKIKLDKIYNAIRKTGYNTHNKQIVVTIGDMGCLGCTGVIRNSLKLLDGVLDVDVNFGEKKAYLSYNASVNDLKDIKKAIENAGHQYIVNVEGEGIENEDLSEIINARDESFCHNSDDVSKH